MRDFLQVSHRVVFTLCSNNYLAQAKTLGDSLTLNNPDYEFIIGLVDEFDKEIDYSFFKPYVIVPIAEIGIPDLDSLWKKYSIVEFNTAVKASYFKYIFTKRPQVTTICFFDPDIVIYHSLKILEDQFVDNDILLTPHILTPIPIDNKQPGENVFLNYGLYNLGFLGIHRNSTMQNGFLDWWEARTLLHGFHDTEHGMFVDQLWINLVPLYYPRVKILRDFGLNVAPWNLHERFIQFQNGSYTMSNGSPLYFYHFSTYLFNEPDKMSKYYNRYDFKNHPELKDLYNSYRQSLVNNKIEEFSSIVCNYIRYRNEYLSSRNKIPSGKQRLRNRIRLGIKQLIPPLILNIKNGLK